LDRESKQTTVQLPQSGEATSRNDSGFTILETAIALVLMAIVGLGITSVLAYSVKNNVSAGDRELAMAVAQQRLEQLRNVAFTDTSLAATSGSSATLTRAGRQYTVVTTITDSDVINGQATTKTINVKVTPNSDGATWATTISSIYGSVTLVSVRTALTIGPNRQL
jgi:type II secretory pathway pseudopilin PulG